MQSPKPITVGMSLDEAIRIAGDAVGHPILAKSIGIDVDGTFIHTLNVWLLDDETNLARGAGDTPDNPAEMMRREYTLNVAEGVIVRLGLSPGEWAEPNKCQIITE